MVISIIALLIALLLPALSRARESAQVALCLSKQKQLVLATLQYAEDHDGIVPPGDDGRAPGWPAGTWPNILLPWAGDEDIYKCPNARFPDNHIVYAPNGHMWLFYAHWGFPHRGIPTNIHTVKTPGRLLHMTENAEDIAIDQRNLSVWPWPGANYSSSFKHYISFNPGTYGNAGHHFRGGGRRHHGILGIQHELLLRRARDHREHGAARDAGGFRRPLVRVSVRAGRDAE